jgi:glycine/D-amino acid oxidase-like deaminating enzyme
VETVDRAIQTRTVVLAAGYRSAALLAPLGVDLPLTPVRHTIALVNRTGGFGEIHAVIADRPQGSYYRSEGPGISLIGAVDPLEGDVDADVETARQPSETHIRRLVEHFWKRFPSQAEAGLRPGYTGVYDCTPDFQPALGPVAAVPGLYVAAGFSGHGFKLSPAVGRLMAEIILEGNAPFVDIGMFRIERFADGELIDSPGGYAARSLS